MSVVGICHICGRPATSTCQFCGRLVCRNCLDPASGTCIMCQRKGGQEQNVFR